MKLERVQALVNPTTAAAIRSAAGQERLALSDYLRRVVEQHLEGQAIVEPVRIALAEATTLTIQQALAAFESATERQLAEVRAEREESRQQISDFVELLAGTFTTKPTEPAIVRAPDRPIK